MPIYRGRLGGGWGGGGGGGGGGVDKSLEGEYENELKIAQHGNE